MANNKVSSLFNVDLPAPKRSNFNLGRVNRFTADIGYVIPCYTEEILANSYKRLDLTALIQTNATTAPLMGSFKVKFDAFFVPLRLYHRHLDLNNIDANFDDNFDLHYFSFPDSNSVTTTYGMPSDLKPTAASGVSIGVSDSSLIDYLGMYPVGFTSRTFVDRPPRVNGEPFIAYFDIWRNYYSNPHDKFVPYRTCNSDNPVIYPSGAPSGVGYADRVNIKYFHLDALDKFITRIQTDSVSSYGTSLVGMSQVSIVPRSIDVFSYFNDCIGEYSSRSAENLGQTTLTSQLAAFTSVPLFSFQRNMTFTDSVPHLTDTSNGIHFGLLPRTYMDDYFTARFSNDFVQYMEDSAVVSVEDNSFSITQLRLANRIAKYVDKSIFSDTRFGSWIKAHFGVKTNQKLNIPQFLGSMTSNIVFNDIYATAQTASNVDAAVTDNTALGSRSSLGQGVVKGKGSFVEFKATEPGYLMVMFSIIPYVSYFQGIRKMYLKTHFYDLYRPEFDAVGYDDLQKVELNANPRYYPAGVLPGVDTNTLTFESYNVSVGKHPSWIEYMTAFDESHGAMTRRFKNGSWVLNRPFNAMSYNEDFFTDFVYTNTDLSVPMISSISSIGYQDTMDDYFDPSTYINADYFNNIFAVNKFIDNFQVQVRFFDKTKQPMSKQILPHL